MLWGVGNCTLTPLASRPMLPAPLWHSRQSVNTTGRVSIRELAEPCGTWQDMQPSARSGACSKTNGPRLSAWQLMHGSSLALAVSTCRGRAPLAQVGWNDPCGLWQSVQFMKPSFTRCLNGMENWARTFIWQPSHRLVCVFASSFCGVDADQSVRRLAYEQIGKAHV